MKKRRGRTSNVIYVAVNDIFKGEKMLGKK